MNEAATFQARKHPAALAVVVLMHGAALTALALAKTEVISNPFRPIKVIPIEPDKTPPPDPQQQVERQKPTQETVISTPERVIQLPGPGPTVQWKPLPTPTFVIPNPGPQTVIIPEPTPPPAVQIEPARARANLASYVSDADYPGAAIRGGEQGTTRFRLGVGPDGHVTQCTVTASSGSTALDAATCRLMKSRARFTPARGSDGKPTGDSVASAIRWVLPTD